MELIIFSPLANWIITRDAKWLVHLQSKRHNDNTQLSIIHILCCAMLSCSHNFSLFFSFSCYENSFCSKVMTMCFCRNAYLHLHIHNGPIFEINAFAAAFLKCWWVNANAFTFHWFIMVCRVRYLFSHLSLADVVVGGGWCASNVNRCLFCLLQLDNSCWVVVFFLVSFKKCFTTLILLAQF